MEPAIEEDTIADNILEGGELAAVIQAEATDNLEVGAQTIAIQMDANDNETNVQEEDLISWENN